MVFDMAPVVYEGQLVALAGPTRCHVIAGDLSAEQLQVVLLMCHFVASAPVSGGATADLSADAETYAKRALGLGAAVSRRRAG
jgi:hypothetical protein